MQQLLERALTSTVSAVRLESARIPVHHLNESVFRFLFQQALLAASPSVELLPECRKIDLVVRAKRSIAFVEFKYLVHSRGYDPTTLAPLASWKSYPSPANQRQFLASVRKLKAVHSKHPVLRLVVLFYSDPHPQSSRSYHAWYASSEMPQLAGLHLVKQLRPFRCSLSEAQCYASLYVVAA